MTKRPRPWGDSEDYHHQGRLRKSHISQKDHEKKSQVMMASIYSKTLGFLFNASSNKKISAQTSKSAAAGESCESCVSSSAKANPCQSCPSCQRMTCASCQESCESCSSVICSICSLQSPMNFDKRRCLYC